MDDDELLELLETYLEMVAKQDEIIYRFGKIIERQATDLKLLTNNREFEDPKLESDIAIANEVLEQYNEMKDQMEP